MKQPIPALTALATIALGAASPVLGATPARADHHAAAATEEADPWTGFRAVGNEPFWSLTIGETQFNFEHMSVFSATAPRTEPQFTPNGSVFMSRAEGGEQRDFIVLVEDQICSDSMAGTPYPKTVRVFVEGQAFAGCGGDPQAVLSGGDWQVTELGGVALPDTIDQHFSFDGMGGLSGAGGCNRFTTRYELSEGISFGPIAATRMACPMGNIGQLENQLFEALGAVISMDISDDGVLTLYAPEGPVLTARR